MPNHPHSVKACVIGGTLSGGGGIPGEECATVTTPLHRNRVDFKAPNAGAENVFKYLVIRTNDNAVVVEVPPVLGQTEYFGVDPGEVPNGQTITYVVRAEYVDDDNNPATPVPLSGPSNPASVTGVNVAPVANADGGYTVKKNKTINIAAPGVLSNDTDVDSPASSLRAVRFSIPPPSLGTVTLNANGLGGFTFTAGNMAGPVTFTYKVYNTCSLGTPPTAPAPPPTAPQCSAYSNAGTVTITVQ